MPKSNIEKLKEYIREIPDYPKKGILFYDITTLLQDSKSFNLAISLLLELVRKHKITKVVSIESRGFIFGSVLAYRLNCGLVLVRKKGKLPHKTLECDYALEYGQATLEIHEDAITKNDRVLIVDDLLATGGTAMATRDLVGRLGGKTVGFCFLIELDFLKGRSKLRGSRIFSLLHYQS